MDKNEALKIVLVDACCNNGKKFCPVCPLYKEDDCGKAGYTEEQLLAAVTALCGAID